MARIRGDTLRWCAGAYADALRNDVLTEESEGGGVERKEKGATASSSAPPSPSYGSVLDDSTVPSHGRKSPTARFLSTARFLLFTAGSAEQLPSGAPEFVSRTLGPGYLSPEVVRRARLCASSGADVDDATIRIVLDSARTEGRGLTQSLALALLEDLVMNCRQGLPGNLVVEDPKLITDLYALAEFVPHRKKAVGTGAATGATPSPTPPPKAKAKQGNKRKAPDSAPQPCEKAKQRIVESPERIAHPGKWWRVTTLSLVMCGASPSAMGAAIWNRHPTLCALMKMTTSGRYRFPTADCDERRREAMRDDEAKARARESAIAATLFVPSQPPVRAPAPPPREGARGGPRVSARQRERQRRAAQAAREEAAARERAAAIRAGRLSKKYSRCVALWDPLQPARKPPREAVPLVLSAVRHFGTAEALRRCTAPVDYLVRTAGEVKLSYDWLIPLVAEHQEIIGRLPAGLSCFLLLQAYAEGGTGTTASRLLELASPLLNHVRKCLKGDFGEEDAVVTMRLLLADVSDKSPGRRKYARRVLQEAIGDGNHAVHGSAGWLFTLADGPHAGPFVQAVVECARAVLAYERGAVLRSFVMALHGFKDHGGGFDFIGHVVNLISNRKAAHDCIKRYSDFRELILKIVYEEFERYLSAESTSENGTLPLPQSTVQFLSLSSRKERTVPTPLLHATLVILSIWREEVRPGDACGGAEDAPPADGAVLALSRHLIVQPDGVCDGVERLAGAGASGAVLLETGARAVTVKHWVLLAKSPCAYIARHAALAAPVIFLPRLLLCSGLARPAFEAMLNRLGKLGDSSADTNIAFRKLIAPAATSEWGISIGSRKSVALKIFGRINAYRRIYAESGSNVVGASSFVDWISNECDVEVQPKKGKKNKTSKKRIRTSEEIPVELSSVAQVENFFNNFDLSSSIHFGQSSEEEWSLDDDTHFDQNLQKTAENDNVSDTIKSSLDLIRCGDFLSLESLLQQVISTSILTSISTDGSVLPKVTDGAFHEKLSTLAVDLINTSPPETYLPHWTRLVSKWFPLLTSSTATDDIQIWEQLFKAAPETYILSEKIHLLIKGCVDCWSAHKTKLCADWILSQSAEADSSCFSSNHMLSFLCSTLSIGSVQFSLQKFDLVAAPVPVFIDSSKQINNLISLCFKSIFTQQNAFTRQLLGGNDNSIENFPHWLVLMIVIAKKGPRHSQTLVSRLIKYQAGNFEAFDIAPIIMLHLYTYLPSTISLRDAKVRELLLKAADSFSPAWLSWCCPLDSKLKTKIRHAVQNPHQITVQAVADVSKQHPLLVARHIGYMIELLEQDGRSAHPEEEDERLGRCHTVRNEFATAIYDQETVRLSTRHWGYSFTQNSWLGVLDSVTSLPKEVLFHKSTFKMGLLELFNLYIKLLTVQLRLAKENYVSIRAIIARFTNILKSFREANVQGYDFWAKSEIDFGVVSILLAQFEKN